VDGYLEKPIRPLDLLHRVEKLLQTCIPHFPNRVDLW